MAAMRRRASRTAALGAALALALALALAGCGDVVLAGRSRTGLDPPPGTLTLEFPETEVGKKSYVTLTLANHGRAKVDFTPVPPEAPWSWDLALPPGRSTVELPGGGALAAARGLTITFGFAPNAHQEGKFTGVARLESPDGQYRYEIRLVGRGIEDPVLCSPHALFFGHVVIGEERTASVRCKNRSSRPVRILVPSPIPQTGNRFVVAREVEEVELPPYDRREIPIRFTADHDAGPVRAFLPLFALGDDGGRDPLVPGNGIELTGHAVPTHVVQLGDASPDPTLDFGFVPVDGNADLSLALRNRYDRAVSWTAEWEVGGDPDFETLEAEGTLGPVGGTEDRGSLRVRFSPDALGLRERRLRVQVQREDAVGVVEDLVTVRGFGGGPEVVCEPGALHFGRTAVGSPVVGAVECRNVGADLPIPEDDLEFVGARVGGDLFHPHEYPRDGGLRVEVEYRANAPGLDIDELEVVTCTGAGCAAAVRSGDGRIPQQVARVQLTANPENLPPEAYCDAVFEPAALDFGKVGPDAGEARLAPRLVNRGAHECWVSAVDVEPAAPPGIELPGRPTAWWTLPPGASVPLPVVFRPAAVPGLEVRATAGVWISNPMRPRLELPIRAVAGGSCLELDPPAVDITEGRERVVDPALACGAPDVRATVRNRCTGTWQVTGIAPAAGSAPGFSVPAPGGLPAYLSPGMELVFPIDFRPAADGIHDGGVRIDVLGPDGAAEALFLPVTGEAAAGGTWFDRIDLVKPQLDLLVVLSSSYAMQGRPIVAELASHARIAAMDQALRRPDLDWQLGITSTDLATPGTSVCTGGGWNGGEAGRLIPATGGGPRILAPGPDFEAAFRANVQAVRPCPGLERAFDAAVLAVSEPLITSALDPRFPPNGQGNKGLSRDGAHLAVVFVSAGDDQSTRPAADVIAALAARKAPELFSTWAILGDPATGCASPGVGSRYWEAAPLTGQVPRSACAPDTWDGLWGAAGNLASRARSTYPLSAPAPGRDAVRLTHVKPNGSRGPVPAGCEYDPARKAIVIGVGAMQALFEEGGRLEAVYPLACDGG